MSSGFKRSSKQQNLSKLCFLLPFFGRTFANGEYSHHIESKVNPKLGRPKSFSSRNLLTNSKIIYDLFDTGMERPKIPIEEVAAQLFPSYNKEDSNQPSLPPTLTKQPSSIPTHFPSVLPSQTPTEMPSTIPSVAPSLSSEPSLIPTKIPSMNPSHVPTVEHSQLPSTSPSNVHTSPPTVYSSIRDCDSTSLAVVKASTFTLTFFHKKSEPAYNITTPDTTKELLRITHEFLNQNFQQVLSNACFHQLSLDAFIPGRRRLQTIDYTTFGTIGFEGSVSFWSDDVPTTQVVDDIVKKSFQGKQKNMYIQLLQDNTSEHGDTFKITENVMIAFPSLPYSPSLPSFTKSSTGSIKKPYKTVTIVILVVLAFIFVAAFTILKRREKKQASSKNGLLETASTSTTVYLNNKEVMSGDADVATDIELNNGVIHYSSRSLPVDECSPVCNFNGPRVKECCTGGKIDSINGDKEPEKINIHSTRSLLSNSTEEDDGEAKGAMMGLEVKEDGTKTMSYGIRTNNSAYSTQPFDAIPEDHSLPDEPYVSQVEWIKTTDSRHHGEHHQDIKDQDKSALDSLSTGVMVNYYKISSGVDPQFEI